MGVLRKIFGPAHTEIWQQLADELGGQYNKSTWSSGDVVKFQVLDWTFTLDTYTVNTGKATITYTRMRAPYVNKDGFRFTIFSSNFLSEIAKYFGMQDIEVGPPDFDTIVPMFGLPSSLDKNMLTAGHADFDKNFIIQGNDEEKVKLLFKNKQLRQLIQEHPSFYMQVRDDEGWFGKEFPEGVDELHFCIPGIITDLALLKNLYQIFAVTLNTLCHIGSAYESDPKFEL